MRSIILLAVIGLTTITARAESENAMPAKLPQHHEYQRTIRQFLATLQVDDFDHRVTEPITMPVKFDDMEELYRNWVMSLDVQPVIGSKRGYPSVSSPPRLFLLSSIEGGEQVMVPPIWPKPLSWLATWDFDGNPYREKQAAEALKLRAFVHCAVSLMMLDQQLEFEPDKGGNRPDWLSPSVIQFAYPYARIKDVLPKHVRGAYEVGLRKMGERLLDWDVKREEIKLDMFAVAAVWHVSRALEDPEFSAKAEAYARRLLTSDEFVHPAGYFVERGGPDVGYGGIAGYAIQWVALGGDWPIAQQTIDRWYRLRAHLVLPDPDGSWFGPTHFNTRLGQDAYRSQWDWGFRDYAGSLVSDHVVWQTKLPSKDEMLAGVARRVGMLNQAIQENPRTRENGKLRHLTNDELKCLPWQFRLWPSFNFPVVTNPGHDYYRAGAYQHRHELETSNSPMLRSPYQRDETFVRDFAHAFTAVRKPGYACILHTGPVGRHTPNSAVFKFSGPYGLGGGQLSAFWTPSTGSVILGRRGGMHWDATIDKVEQWRLWPIHAVSGTRPGGGVFTSARILDPAVESSLDEQGGKVRVGGVIQRECLEQGKVLDGRLTYEREFTIHEDSLHVQTSLASTGQDVIAELYDTIPVFLRELRKQSKAKPTTIEFEVEKKFSAATAEWTDRVRAIRLQRFDGSVQITFDRPRRVRLSDVDWSDSYISRATCRNILIDLLDGQSPAVPRSVGVGYTIASVRGE